MKRLLILAMISLTGNSIFSMHELNMSELRARVRQRAKNSTEPRPVIVLPKNDAEGLEQAKQALRSQGTVALRTPSRKLSKIEGNRFKLSEQQSKACLVYTGGCLAWLAVMYCWYMLNPLSAQEAPGNYQNLS